jgi:hypothetical protein
MPLVNYCRKCKTEVPDAGVCPRCGGRLTRAGERLSFGRERMPVTDWFAWNAVLRVATPVLALVLAATVAAEAFTEGAAGVRAVFLQGFFSTLLVALGTILLATLAALLTQGRETVRYALDKTGAHVYTYLRSPARLRLFARLLTPRTLRKLQAEAPEAAKDGLVFVHRADFAWADTRRAQFWPETRTILLYRSRWWQAVYIRCGEADYGEAEAFVRGRVARGRSRKKRRK